MFPSTISTFPIVNPTDRLNSPSHSALHNSVSSVLTQVETIIGLSTSSAIGTLMYDVRSPASDGGGHVQSAVKGGTGQTTFTKGDTFVATGPSTISKLAVGGDGTVPIANSSAASGINWKMLSNKILASVRSSIIIGTVAETSIFSTTIPASVLGTSNAIRTTVNLNNFYGNGGGSVLLRTNYGVSQTSMLVKVFTSNTPSAFGYIEHTIINNGNATTQFNQLKFKNNLPTNVSGVCSVYGAYKTSITSVDSASSQTYGMTAMLGNTSGEEMSISNVIVQAISN